MSYPAALVDQDTVSQILSSDVLNAKGETVLLSSFCADKTILVFIRHFFCGSCQQYVAQLASVRDDALEDAHATIVVVGCGDWDPISAYAEITQFRGPILADPSRKLYRTLGMIEHVAATPSGVPVKSYLTQGVVTNVLKSIWNGPLKQPWFLGKQGNLSQVGGELILGPDKECIFAYRMQHSADHTEIPELMSRAGVQYP